MEITKTSRPTRTRRETAKKRAGASAYELTKAIHEDCDDSPPSLPPAPTPPPPTPPKPTKKRGRVPKITRPPVSVTAVVPSDSGENAVISGHAVPEVLETAKATIATTIATEETDGYNSDGEPAKKIRRKAKLKTEEQLEREAKKGEKLAEQVEFTKSIPDVKTVDFQPFAQGPRREPRIKLPPDLDLDLDSPYTMFSLFWTEEMWKILAENTNAYALRQGVTQRDAYGNGVRLDRDRDNGSMNQRIWYTTNASELKVFIGTVIYMGLHSEGRRASYWNKDLYSGPNYTPTL